MDLLNDSKLGWLQKNIHNSTYGMGYEETFHLVMKMTTICTLIALALVQQ